MSVWRTGREGPPWSGDIPNTGGDQIRLSFVTVFLSPWNLIDTEDMLEWMPLLTANGSFMGCGGHGVLPSTATFLKRGVKTG